MSPQPQEASPILWVDDTVDALGALAAHYRANVINPSTVVVAVTGSNGKTTTKWMIDHVLSDWLEGYCSPKSFNNHSWWLQRKSSTVHGFFLFL